MTEDASSQTLDTDIKYLYSPRNIFHLMLAKILKIECESFADGITRCPTNIDSTGRGDAF